MNQRSKRASDKKHQNLEQATMHTGGHVAAYGRNIEPEVKVSKPNFKVTGDVPSESLSGLAKASPNFKKTKEIPEEQTPKDEKRAIAKSTEETL